MHPTEPRQQGDTTSKKYHGHDKTDFSYHVINPMKEPFSIPAISPWYIGRNIYGLYKKYHKNSQRNHG